MRHILVVFSVFKKRMHNYLMNATTLSLTLSINFSHSLVLIFSLPLSLHYLYHPNYHTTNNKNHIALHMHMHKYIKRISLYKYMKMPKYNSFWKILPWWNTQLTSFYIWTFKLNQFNLISVIELIRYGNGWRKEISLYLNIFE